MSLKETAEVSALLEGSAKALQQVRADNKIGLEDLFALSPLVDLGKDAIFDSTKIIGEIRDATDEQLKEELIRFVLANFSFVQEVSALMKMVTRFK